MKRRRGKGLFLILCIENDVLLKRIQNLNIWEESDTIINTQSQSLKLSGDALQADLLVVDSYYSTNNFNLLNVVRSKIPNTTSVVIMNSGFASAANPGMKFDFTFHEDNQELPGFSDLISKLRNPAAAWPVASEFPADTVFNAILKNMAEGFMYVDNDDTIIYANEQFYNMLGYSQNELIGKQGYKFLIADEDRDILLEKNKARRRNVSDHYEIRMVKKNGELLWVSVIGTPVTNAEGEVIGSVGIISDIHSTKKSETVLRRSTGILNTMLTNISIALLETDASGNVVFIEGKAIENVGVNTSDTLGKNISELFKGVNLYLSTGETVPMEIVMERVLQGEYINGYTEYVGYNFENYLTPLFNDNGMVAGSVIFSLDVTERMTFLNKIRETEDKYQTLVENINDIIVSINRDYRIDYISPVVKRMLGYEPDEMMGAPVQEYIFVSDALPFRDGVMAVFTGIARPIEFRAVTKMGTIKWLRASLRPQYLNGRIISAQGIFSDVTEQKDMEDKLILARDRAQEVSRLKSYFLANMSHELRTPMIGILGYAEILQDELKDDETKRMAETIFASGNRLLETLNLILDLSKIESGKLEIINVDINIRAEIDNCIATFATSAAKKGLYLTFYPGEPVSLKLDKRLFRDTMNNLLSNALKFTHIGGITVAVNTEEEEEKKFLAIAVTDTGIGIPERSKSLIFEEFRQVSQGYGREYEGTGLGLSVSKKFVESMGGKIIVESIEGSGSTFTLIFPMENEG